MAIREIVCMGDPVLRAEAEEVTVFDEDLQALVRDMFETMYHADGIGLAAPQIGVSTRVIVVDLRRRDEDDPESQQVALVNPVVTWESKELAKQAEGCLSIPGLEDVVQRPVSVRVEGRILTATTSYSRRMTCLPVPSNTRSITSTESSSSIGSLLSSGACY